jgi:hypothetical protein
MVQPLRTVVLLHDTGSAPYVIRRRRTDTTNHSDRIVIYPSRVKTALVLLGAIGFVALCAWLVSLGVRRVGVEGLVASLVGVPFFGICGLYAAYRLVHHRPAVEIDRMGIVDGASALGVGRLLWDEVDHVQLYEYFGQPMLGIIPRELELFLSRQHPLRRSITKLNLKLGCAPVNVPQVILPMKLEQLADLLARYGVRVEGRTRMA